MKRFVLVFSGVLFLMLTGCIEPAGSPSVHATNANNTLTAVYTTPSPTSTPTPDGNSLVHLLNSNIGKVNNELSDAIDAHFMVMDVSVVDMMGAPFVTLYVFINCECVKNSNCCTPERSFVMVVSAMNENRAEIMPRLPPNIMELQVVCSDHFRQIGTVVVSWYDLSLYLDKSINGYQLGNRIRSTPIP